MENTFVFHDYRLKNDFDAHIEQYNLTPHISELLESAYTESIESKEKKTGERLSKLVSQYPHIPMFKNYLMAFYYGKGDIKKAQEINNITLREHPDYLFGKINFAHKCISDGHPEKVPEILGQTLELKNLYPEREVFQVSELKDFLMVIIRYYSVTKQFDLAREKLKMLMEFAPDDPITEQAEEIVLSSFLAEKREERMQFMEKYTIGKGKPVPHSSKTKPPKFNHDEIHSLYWHDMSIPYDILHEILQLPRQTLIADLETVLVDAVVRYQFLYETIDDDLGDNFALHALFLLAELKAEESLPQVLHFLSYDVEFLDFWVGDHLTETLWRCIYPLVSNQTETLKQFIQEPDIYTYAKAAASEALGQLALHQPERRGEIIDFYSEIFSTFTQWAPKQVNPDLIGILVEDAIDCGLSELLPQIKTLFDLEYFDLEEMEGYNEIATKANEPVPADRIRPLMSIFELYELINTRWLNYYFPDDDEDEDDDFDLLDDLSDDELSDWGKKILRLSSAFTDSTPSTPKAGRNDPCPCGSGKKYKKCCMEKEED